MSDTVTVPREPTEAMIRAGVENNATTWTDETDRGFPEDVANDVYRAMIAASPPSEPGEVERLREELKWAIDSAEGAGAHMDAFMKRALAAEATVERLTAELAKAESRDLIDALVAMSARAEKAEAALAEAREALRPFAEVDVFARGVLTCNATLVNDDLRRARDVYAALASSGDGWRATHRHVKRGTTYRMIGEAELQSAAGERIIGEGETFTVYRGEDGTLWARHSEEFNDGRFEPLPKEASNG